jgi:hypothetical protein
MFAAVSNGTADSGYSAAESRLGNDATTPDAGEQVVVADDAMAIANEMKKDVEDLRFNADASTPRRSSRRSSSRTYSSNVWMPIGNALGWTGLQHDLNEKSRRSQSA